jgi:hypothetical protein
MNYIQNSTEFQMDSKGINRNGDGHLHLRKDVDGEMGMATSTLKKMWMATRIRNSEGFLEGFYTNI